ncbi:MAG: helix-turn-helix transcriptional regulator [Proteobacteria bacterium]|nr:helix-turn-helix transcriptional regulator [Pseudomonadota bacterium]
MADDDHAYVVRRCGERLGDRIRAVRVAQDISQAELGRAIGAHTSTVSSWERGASISVPWLVAIAHALRVQPNWLFAQGDL